MENGLLIAAAAFGGCAGLAALVVPGHKTAAALRRGLWIAAAALALAAFGLMLGLLLTDRFDYSYVSQHSQKAQAALYKVSALWAGQEGSFLLWSVALAVTGLPLLRGKDRRSARVFGVYALLSACVFAMCAVSNPFARNAAAPADGLGLTAALQSPWMAAHPPLVFAAYSAMAALAAQAAVPVELSEQASTHIQRWTRFAWVTLGLGIFTGSIWAYGALGWGGYWAWDPIENAALVPWLILCGYLHTGETAGRARCVIPFAAACTGAFLTRSGILGDTSAHAYAEGDIVVSALILVLVLAAIAGAVIVKLRRRKRPETTPAHPLRLGSPQLFAISAYGYAALVFAGTAAPLATGSSTPVMFYTIITAVFALVYTALLLARDKEALKRRFLPMAALSTAAVVGAALALGRVRVLPLLLLWACLMPLSLWIVSGFKTRGWRYYLLHIGIVLMTAGVIFSMGLGGDGMAVIDPTGTHALIGGISSPLPGVLGADVTILSSPLGDVIVQGGSAFSLPDGSVVIPFVSRPMIGLFWVGGVLAALGPWLAALVSKIAHARAARKTGVQANQSLPQ